MADVEITTARPALDPSAITDLRDRLRRTRRLPTLDGTRPDDWSRGVPDAWLTDVLERWAAFDVDSLEADWARWSHHRARIGTQDVHVLVAEGAGPEGSDIQGSGAAGGSGAEGAGPAPLPLLLANGWPSSFGEYREVLPLLTDPGAHSADPADAFTVIVPALPGFGFSAAPPPGGVSAAQVAGLWHALMTDGLGHDRYVAHGSDLGCGVVAQLARAYPDAVAGIHLATPGLQAAPPPAGQSWTPVTQAYADEVAAWTAEQGSYAHQHSTKPSTVGAALNDSPAGLAAWIGEKFVAWSSGGADGFPTDLLLATLTLYWATGSIATSMLPYWAGRHVPGAALSPDEQSPVPTAVDIFGGERVPLPHPPREVAERYYRITRWQEHDRGGHFPAAAEPELFARALREAFRPLR